MGGVLLNGLPYYYYCYRLYVGAYMSLLLCSLLSLVIVNIQIFRICEMLVTITFHAIRRHLRHPKLRILIDLY